MAQIPRGLHGAAAEESDEVGGDVNDRPLYLHLRDHHQPSVDDRRQVYERTLPLVICAGVALAAAILALFIG